MRDDTPIVYLLAGPSGPGKDAYVQALTERGVQRLQVGTELTDESAAAVAAHLESGRDVLVDYASATRDERSRLRLLADASRAESLIVNFATR
jgi:predicted kinase